MASSIINSDDGVVSGTSGLKTTGGDDGALAVQSNGTEVAKFKTTELVINDGGANYDFRVEGDTDANLLVADASADRVGVGTASPGRKLEIQFDSATTYSTSEFSSTSNSLYLKNANTTTNAFTGIEFLVGTNGEAAISSIRTGDGEAALAFGTRGGGSRAERARITSGGDLLVGKTSESVLVNGVQAGSQGYLGCSRNAATALYVNRTGDDGGLVAFFQDSTEEGFIGVSGTTVSYNGGHLSRWAQTTTAKDESLKKGTVLSNLDEMNVYVDADGNPVENEQLNKVKVSDVEGDANVAGVFVNWDYDEAHQVDEINMAMTGDMIIRIAQGTTVARGDLLMSAGDGTAKPQGDDIVRSKTIAKVTSTHVTCTYDDGSYCVPCVLMAC